MKHGAEVFEFAEVFTAFTSGALNDTEIAFIAELQPAYNTTKGGAGHRGVVHSSEYGAAISKRLKQQWADPQWRATQLSKLLSISKSPEAVERGRKLARLRQATYVPKPPKPKKPHVDMAEKTRSSWKMPEVRKARMAGLKLAMNRPEVRARKSEIARNRVVSVETAQRIARAKWKPVYCPELQCSFLSQKSAAEFLGVLTTSISNAIKQKGRVAQKYTLIKVA